MRLIKWAVALFAVVMLLGLGARRSPRRIRLTESRRPVSAKPVRIGVQPNRTVDAAYRQYEEAKARMGLRQPGG
jgi:hypothetical protein